MYKLVGNSIPKFTMEKELFSTSEAAKILGISRVAVFKKIKSEEIKATKVGRNYVIEKGTLLEAVGHNLGLDKKRQIEMAVEKAFGEYGDALRKLGKE